MELLKAIDRLNKLNKDIASLEDWIAETQFKTKPVTGRSWIKVEKALKEAVYDLCDERDELEEKIKEATVGIEIDCK